MGGITNDEHVGWVESGDGVDNVGEGRVQRRRGTNGGDDDRRRGEEIAILEEQRAALNGS